jgi:hypothetical protein
MKFLVTAILLCCMLSHAAQVDDRYSPADIIGHWRITAFDAYGTPNTDSVAIIEFKTNLSWIVRISELTTSTNCGNYSICGNQLSIINSETEPFSDYNRFMYTNAVFESTAPDHKRILRKLRSKDSLGKPEQSIYPEIKLIRSPTSPNTFIVSNTTARTVYIYAGNYGPPTYQINYERESPGVCGIAMQAPDARLSPLKPHAFILFSTATFTNQVDISAWQVCVTAFASTHKKQHSGNKIDPGPHCQAETPWFSTVKQK